MFSAFIANTYFYHKLYPGGMRNGGKKIVCGQFGGVIFLQSLPPPTALTFAPFRQNMAAAFCILSGNSTEELISSFLTFKAFFFMFGTLSQKQSHSSHKNRARHLWCGYDGFFWFASVPSATASVFMRIFRFFWGAVYY